MKKKIILLFVLSLVLIQSSLVINTSFAVNNSSYDSKKIELITNYIYKLKREIRTFKNKYEINNDIELENEINELEKIQKVLNNIDNYEQEKAEKVYLLALEKLKTSKDNIKNILKFRKYDYEKKFKAKKEFYIKVTIRLNSQLNEIIAQIYNNIENKSNLSQQDYEIISILKRLNEENIKLKNFSKTNFSSKSEMSDYVVKLLKNVKSLMFELKKYD